MAKTAINVGSSANDGTGDPLRTAMQSTNSNIDEIYALFGNGSTLAISGDATVSSGSLTIANDAVTNAKADFSGGSLNIGGNGSSGGITIADGSIQMRTGTGSVAEIRMYCESSNAHFQTIKAQPHASASSAVLTLPTATGTLVGTGDTSSVSHGMLGASFKTIVALGSGTSVDWSAGQVFTKTLSGDTTLTFANVSTGMQINLVIDGNYQLTLPTSVKELNGASTYDGSGEHLVSIVSTNGSTEQFATINKIAS
jgi:hypothetical protein